jgi:hypothetical protein
MRKVHNILADLPDGDPGLQVFDNVVHLIEQMESLACDKNNPEDVDTDQEDHSFDTLKYGLTNESRVVAPAPRVKTHNPMEVVLGLRR